MTSGQHFKAMGIHEEASDDCKLKKGIKVCVDKCIF